LRDSLQSLNVQDRTATVLPPDLQRLVDDWLEVERQADALVGPLDDEQFNWCPAAGVWSIGQCLDHLNTMNALYLELIRGAIATTKTAGLKRTGPIASTWFGRRFIASQEPGGMKVKTLKRMRPASRKLKAEVWPEFVRLHNQLRTLVTVEGPDVDLNKARFPNPFVPGIKMRAGTALRLLAAHDRRHVAQAHGVRRSPGFPRS
jgi:hypothetical protein